MSVQLLCVVASLTDKMAAETFRMLIYSVLDASLPHLCLCGLTSCLLTKKMEAIHWFRRSRSAVHEAGKEASLSSSMNIGQISFSGKYGNAIIFLIRLWVPVQNADCQRKVVSKCVWRSQII